MGAALPPLQFRLCGCGQASDFAGQQLWGVMEIHWECSGGFRFCKVLAGIRIPEAERQPPERRDQVFSA